MNQMMLSGGETSNLANSDENCEALVACENLPSEPLMPRSHKSSARSFLKNFGQFGGGSSGNTGSSAAHGNSQQASNTTNSRSFLQNLSQTTSSRQTSSNAG